MKNLILLFSHSLTGEQLKDAKHTLGINRIITLPDNLKNIWSNIPPELPVVNDCIYEIKDWLLENANKGDYVLIQGEFGATYLMVNFSFKHGYIPVYATTKRINREKIVGDKVINEKVFKHVRFRFYERND